MPEVQDETKREGATGTVIRRRARTVVGTPKSEPAPAGSSPETKTATPPATALETKPGVKETVPAAAKAPAADATAPARTAKTETPEPAKPASAAPSRREVTPSPYQARIISKPVAPPKGLPKQEITDDDIAKDMAANILPGVRKPGVAATPGTPVPATDDARKKAPRRRQEVSRRVLQEEAAAFGRMNRLKNKKKKSAYHVEAKQTEITTPKAIKRIIKMEDKIFVGDLAKRMSIKASDIIKKLFDMGLMVTVNQSVDFDTATLIATDFEFEVQQTVNQDDVVLEQIPDAPEMRLARAPIVTVMGHVDHGKTTLLDAIRKSDVAGGEHGGITQHIGAYEVHLEDGRKVTFLDTPGHAAFAAMRARGAKITDVIILVVAADDGIMPQTIEAINHAKAAGVPILVAVNKIDKPGADVERIKKALTEYELVPEEWGGTTIVVPVSAKSGQGLSLLLESLALQSEILELKANPNKRARGAVIEARLERGRGPVATLLVQEGTLRAGDIVVLGQYYGKIRAMTDYRGKEVKVAGPATPVEIQGLNGVPEAGDMFVAVEDEREAKSIAERRTQKARESDLGKNSKVSLDQFYAKIQENEVKELKAIIKSDVQGSAEALRQALQELSTDKVKLTVLHAAAGAVTETDVNLARASDSILVSFNVRPDPKARALAETLNVELRTYSIIYEVVDDIRNLMEGKLAPTLKETILGHAEVREVFHISKLGKIAGCLVIDGKIMRTARVRLLRDSVTIFEGKISSLRRFKDDAREVASGLECGISLEGYSDIQANDRIEAFTIEEVASKL